MIHAKQVTIIGPGLLGASIGLGLKAAGYGGRIVGVSRRLATAQAALDRGAIDAIASDYAVLADTELAVVCVPLGCFREIFAAMAAHDHEHLVITDVGSTKQSVLDDARAMLPDARRFIGSHPMAGSEQQGPEAAQADLFDGKPCILCHHLDEVDRHAAAEVTRLWQALGMKLLHMTPQQHDGATAMASHLPHALAAMLMDVLSTSGGSDAFAVGSTGLCDTSRLASSNPPMRADIMQANRDALLHALDEMGGAMNRLRAALTSGDRQQLVDYLERSKQARDQWISGRCREKT